ncbi:MAG: hypothetical protein ABSH08_15990 [Tepidisphaeraceae bacterium]|jgi:hypothetical protein
MNTTTPQTEFPYELWALFAKEELPHHIAGFVLTDHCRLPGLVAYVDGGDDVAAFTALRIVEGRVSPERATDLRGRPVPESLLLKFLVPIPLSATADHSAIVGTFYRPMPGTLAIFTLVSRPGAAALVKLISQKLRDGDPSEEGEI